MSKRHPFKTTDQGDGNVWNSLVLSPIAQSQVYQFYMSITIQCGRLVVIKPSSGPISMPDARLMI